MNLIINIESQENIIIYKIHLNTTLVKNNHNNNNNCNCNSNIIQ